MSDRAKVFISHTRDDKRFAEELAEALSSRGINAEGAWHFDIAMSIEEQLQRVLGESTFYVVLVSDRTLLSPWVFFELGAAIGGRKRLLVVYLSEDARRHRLRTLSEVAAIDATALRPDEVAQSVADAVGAADVV